MGLRGQDLCDGGGAGRRLLAGLNAWMRRGSPRFRWTSWRIRLGSAKVVLDPERDPWPPGRAEGSDLAVAAYSTGQAGSVWLPEVEDGPGAQKRREGSALRDPEAVARGSEYELGPAPVMLRGDEPAWICDRVGHWVEVVAYTVGQVTPAQARALRRLGFAPPPGPEQRGPAVGEGPRADPSGSPAAGAARRYVDYCRSAGDFEPKKVKKAAELGDELLRVAKGPRKPHVRSVS